VAAAGRAAPLLKWDREEKTAVAKRKKDSREKGGSVRAHSESNLADYRADKPYATAVETLRKTQKGDTICLVWA